MTLDVEKTISYRLVKKGRGVRRGAGFLPTSEKFMVKSAVFKKRSSLFNCLTRSFLALVLATAVFSVWEKQANADSITYTTGYGSAPYDPLVATTWATTLALPKFDTSLGTLTGVTITNIGQMLGTIGVENQVNANKTQTIATTLSVFLQVLLPAGGPLISNPLATNTFSLPKYDHTTDYAGTSGQTLSNLSAFNTAFLNVNVADLALYQGIGTISFATTATDTFSSSSTGGTGSYASIYSDLSGILLGIQYDYTPMPSPEPSTFVLLGAGLVGAALLRRKVRKQ
jgi:hypothetical protein